jgi:transposase
VSVVAELAALRAENEGLKRQLAKEQENHRRQIEALQEEIAYWKDKLFGRKSERYGEFERTQMLLFNEAEDGAIGVPSLEEQATYRVAVRGHHRRNRGVRKPLPASLPRVEVLHDIPEEQKVCGCGAMRHRCGEETKEELEFVPGTMYVLRHVRPKYTCGECHGVDGEGPVIKIAAPPPSMVPKGMVGPGFLTQVVASKFEDAVPFYRQVKILRRHGIELGRSTLCGWVLEAAGRMEVLKTLLWEQLLAGSVVQADETKLQVLEEPGRQNETDSWMWVFRGGEPEQPVVIFEYRPTRAGRVPLESLGCFRGYLQTDGYKGYEAIGDREGIIHLGCLAHIRRKFSEAHRVAPKSGQAQQALEYIRKLYEVESRADALKLSRDQRRQLRQEESEPILAVFREWLETKQKQVLPEGHLGKAIKYALGQWQRVIRYLDDGILRPDNNLAENAIRPFCVGRKNWLFAGSPRGAFASATIFTLIETAKANHLEPYHYLHHVFKNLPVVKTEAELLALLPTRLTPAQIAPQA